MLPPIEFSIGRTPYDAAPDWTVSKTSSKLRQGISGASGSTRRAAASLKAPGSP
jgi:hypothetical protein